jgi:hypothetical protein
MLKTTLHFEIDFRALNALPCENCGKPLAAHFQPGPDASKFAGHWCPRPSGGFESRVYTRPAGRSGSD